MSGIVHVREFGVPEPSRSATASRDSRRAVFAVCALIFAASVAVLAMSSVRMRDMGEMPMPGGWGMSMIWTRLPGGAWSDAYVSFIGMWTMMMVVMMIPSLTPALLRFLLAVRARGAMRAKLLTAQVGVVYFLVWAIVGAAIFPLGALISTFMIRLPSLARGAPILTCMIVLLVGILQFTRWKEHQLSCWRDGSWSDGAIAVDLGAAVRFGVRLAIRCSHCCWSFMAILLAVGIMDLRAMALVTVAITVERVAPDAARAGHVNGAVAVGTGLLLAARTIATG